MAILSENQYIEKLNTRAMTRAMIIPLVPQIDPMATNRPPSAAIRIHVFARLMPFISASGRESVPPHLPSIIPSRDAERLLWRGRDRRPSGPSPAQRRSSAQMITSADDLLGGRPTRQEARPGRQGQPRSSAGDECGPRREPGAHVRADEE